MIPLDWDSKTSVIALSLLRGGIGRKSTTLLRNFAGPKLARWWIVVRNGANAKKFGLAATSTIAYTYLTIFTHTNDLIAILNSLGVFWSRASKEYPKPPCPTTSRAVRAIQSSKSTSFGLFSTSLSMRSLSCGASAIQYSPDSVLKPHTMGNSIEHWGHQAHVIGGEYRI